MKLKIIGKFCFIIFRANDYFWLFGVFFALFRMSKLLVAGYLPQMCKNVISNNYFFTLCGFKGFILPEVK